MGEKLPPLRGGQFLWHRLRPDPVHSAGAGVQTANSETTQTIHDPDAHDPSQEYNLPALLALIAVKMSNCRTVALSHCRTVALTH